MRNWQCIRTVQVLLLLSCATRLTYSQRGHLIPCRSSFGDSGQCVSLAHCPEVLQLYKQLPRDEATSRASDLKKVCGNRVTDDQYPVLCCRTPYFGASTYPKPVTTPTTVEPTTTPATATEDGSALRALLNSIPTSNCRDPINDGAGICKPLQNCTVLFERAQHDPTDAEYRQQLVQSNAICNSVGTNVCCPLSTAARTQLQGAAMQLPTEKDGCGRTSLLGTKVLGGVDSEPGAWPWMALIGYDRYSHMPFRCGGALITTRHVLTAAHCIRDDLSFVRLGEFDLTEQNNDERIDIDVQRKVAHPKYGTDSTRHYDIAVLFLVKDVQFTKYVCPVCLPVAPRLRSKSYVEARPYIAGWGRTMESGNAANVLQELQIEIMNNSECNRVYRNLRALYSAEQFNELVLCAGDLAGGRDSCRGDSGGPLMVSEPYIGETRYYAVGIVSYGIGCGRQGVPAVYTNTQQFIDWIAELVAET